jgi:hypothetical protein
MVLADGQVISTPFSDSPRLRVCGDHSALRHAAYTAWGRGEREFFGLTDRHQMARSPTDTVVARDGLG